MNGNYSLSWTGSVWKEEEERYSTLLCSWWCGKVKLRPWAHVKARITTERNGKMSGRCIAGEKQEERKREMERDMGVCRGQTLEVNRCCWRQCWAHCANERETHPLRSLIANCCQLKKQAIHTAWQPVCVCTRVCVKECVYLKRRILDFTRASQVCCPRRACGVSRTVRQCEHSMCVAYCAVYLERRVGLNYLYSSGVCAHVVQRLFEEQSVSMCVQVNQNVISCETLTEMASY